MLSYSELPFVAMSVLCIAWLHRDYIRSRANNLSLKQFLILDPQRPHTCPMSLDNFLFPGTSVPDLGKPPGTEYLAAEHVSCSTCHLTRGFVERGCITFCFVHVESWCQMSKETHCGLLTLKKVITSIGYPEPRHVFVSAFRLSHKPF